MTSKSPKRKAAKQGTCVFCEQGDVCQETHGRLLSKGGVTAHYFCMLFSSGLSQNGKSEKQGILGFLQSDILKEVKRGARLRCSFCRKGGATIGCVIRNCKKMFHLGCGRTNSTLHQFFGTFSSFCSSHRIQQDVPSDDDPSIVCSICMNTVGAAPSNDTIRAPCCRKYWYHRECVQRYATSAGLYFFKCPLCNNKDDFQDEMLTMGIYIPDQDASWEKEPHAFQELLERYSHCDAPVCKCAEGRKYDKDGSKWEIILCDFCGSHGTHVACNHLGKLGKHSICSGCQEVDERTREEEILMNSPPHKRKSLEMLQLELATSPDPSKGSSPYPGPSNAMRKLGLPSPKAGVSPQAKGKSKSKSKSGKRRASLESCTSPPNLKKQKVSNRRTSTVTSTAASIKRFKDSMFSPNTSSQSSEDSSDDDIPFSVLKNKIKLESAWDVKRRRQLENKKKFAERKAKNKNTVIDSDSEVEFNKKLVKKKVKNPLIDSETDTADEEDKKVKHKNKNNNNACKNGAIRADSETQIIDLTKFDSVKDKGRVKHKLNNRLSNGNRHVEKGKVGSVNSKAKKPRISLDCLTTAPTSNVEEKTKQGKAKKQSLEGDKTQTTLMSWFKPKLKGDNTEESKTEPIPEQLHIKEEKKPVVIEWKGKQLLIRSPKVILNRSSRKVSKLKPKNLEIDMNDAKGTNWNGDIDLLSNIEADVRVTRKMIDIDQMDAKNDMKIKCLESPSRLQIKEEENISPTKRGRYRFGIQKEAVALGIDIEELSETIEKNADNSNIDKFINSPTKTLRSKKVRETASVVQADIDEKNDENKEKTVLLEDISLPPKIKKCSTLKKEAVALGIGIEEINETAEKNADIDNFMNSPAKTLRSKKARKSACVVQGDNDEKIDENTEKNVLLEEVSGNKLSVKNHSDGVNTQTESNMEDSPAKNLRARNTNIVSCHTALTPTTHFTQGIALKNPERNRSCSKSILPQSPKTCVAPDSPAKNLRLRLKKRDLKTSSCTLEIPTASSKDSLEEEDQHTPTENQKKSFQFFVTKDNKLSEDDVCLSETDEPSVGTKESTELGTLNIVNKTSSEVHTAAESNQETVCVESQHLNKKQKDLGKKCIDSPAKNLRKRSTQLNKNSEILVETQTEKVQSLEKQSGDSDSDTSVVSSQLERLKRYKPKFHYLTRKVVTSSEEKQGSQADSLKETEAELTVASKETCKGQTETRQQSVIWHLEGTRQLTENTTNNSEYSNGDIENTCPNPQPVVHSSDSNSEFGKEVLSDSPNAKSFTLDDILKEKLAEIHSKFPTTGSELESPDKYCLTAGSDSPSYFTKFRTSTLRSDKSETSQQASHINVTIQNGAVINTNSVSLEQGSTDVALPPTHRNLIEAVRNKNVGKLRSNSRTGKKPASPSPDRHLSDKLTMAEYYGAEENQSNNNVISVIECETGQVIFSN